MPGRPHHVLDQLAGLCEAIRARMMADQEFRSLCEDYDVAFEALRRWEVAADAVSLARTEEFRRLLSELENEILAELKLQPPSPP